MRNILISIRPEFVSKILNGEKTIEIRKSIPKCKLPCKVYIYCTNGYMLYDIRNENYLKVERKCTLDYTRKSNKYLSGTPPMLNRKVVAEFTLDKVSIADCDSVAPFDKETKEYLKCCLSRDEFWDYTNGNCAFAWHIDNLKIYDKPKELSEFYIEIIDDDCCVGCPYHETPIEERPCKNCYGNRKYITRPPQSYMFVEELEE